MSAGAGNSRLEPLFLADEEAFGQLILVRHAQQGLNAFVDPARPKAGDAPLSGLGELQAEAVGRELAGERIDAVYCSPLLRARQTAEAIAQHHGLTPEVDADLVEVGIYRDLPEGTTVADHLSPEQLDALWADFAARRQWDCYPYSESSAGFTDRIRTALHRVLAVHGEQDRIVVVCHAGVINEILARAVGLGADFFTVPGHASVSRVARGDGRLNIRSLNETSHLRHDSTTEVTY